MSSRRKDWPEIKPPQPIGYLSKELNQVAKE
jgi:hypothetical protein